MEITDVRIRKSEKDESVMAYVSITIDNEFAIHDIKIINGKGGVFVAMPSRRDRDGIHRDIVHPINTETRQRIQDKIMEAYNNLP